MAINKKQFLVLGMAATATAVVFPHCCFALDLPTQPNAAIQAGVDFLTASHVGPAVMKIVDVVGKGAVILTAAAFSVENLLKTIGTALNKAGLNAIADKIENVKNMVLPYIRYASLYNVQHSEFVSPAVVPAPVVSPQPATAAV